MGKDIEFILKDKKENPFDPQFHPQVYFLLDGREVVYVGQSKNNTPARVAYHCMDKDFDSFTIIDVIDEDLDEVEFSYICKFKPKYNCTLPKNNRYIRFRHLKKKHKDIVLQNQIKPFFVYRASQEGFHHYFDTEQLTNIEVKNEVV